MSHALLNSLVVELKGKVERKLRIREFLFTADNSQFHATLMVILEKDDRGVYNLGNVNFALLVN